MREKRVHGNKQFKYMTKSESKGTVYRRGSHSIDRGWSPLRGKERAVRDTQKEETIKTDEDSGRDRVRH